MNDLSQLMQRYAEIDAKEQEYQPILMAIADDKQATRDLIGEALTESGMRQVASHGFMVIMQQRNQVELADPHEAMAYLEELDRLREFMVLDLSRYKATFGDEAPGLRVIPRPTLAIRRDKAHKP